jgi:hypothetical protein
VAVATLTFVYADSTAVLGPLGLRAEPGCYDLCRPHSQGLSAPRGWDVIRLPLDENQPSYSSDDLMALANAVRAAAGVSDDPPKRPASVVEVARRGHLTLVTDADSAPGRRS